MITARRLALAAAAAALSAGGAANTGAMAAASAAVGSQAPSGLFNDARGEQLLVVQILLDRAKHSPGVIDGKMGGTPGERFSPTRRPRGLPRPAR